jgi:hypothetical protein
MTVSLSVSLSVSGCLSVCAEGCRGDARCSCGSASIRDDAPAAYHRVDGAYVAANHMPRCSRPPYAAKHRVDAAIQGVDTAKRRADAARRSDPQFSR